MPCYRAVLALCASESGDRERATKVYRWFADQRFSNLPRDTNHFLGLAVLAHVAADLGDAAGATDLTGLLAPHLGELVLLNCYGGGGAAWGPTSWALARLAVTEGRRDDAVGLFERAAAESAALPLVSSRVAAHAARLGYS